MKKLIVLVSMFAFGCSQNETEVTPIENYTFSIDAVLEQNGKQSLLKDSKGFYHLKLLRSTKQQPYRVTGRILVNGKEPKYPHSIQWESNLYWWIKEKRKSSNKMRILSLQRIRHTYAHLLSVYFVISITVVPVLVLTVIESSKEMDTSADIVVLLVI